MQIIIPNIGEEVTLDDDPRLAPLTLARWTGSFCKGFRAPGKGFYMDGLYIPGSPGSHTREYCYIKRQWRAGTKVRSESLQVAVLIALGRRLPGDGERIFFGPLGHLNFTSANLLVQSKPHDGWLLRANHPKNNMKS